MINHPNNQLKFPHIPNPAEFLDFYVFCCLKALSIEECPKIDAMNRISRNKNTEKIENEEKKLL